MKIIIFSEPGNAGVKRHVLDILGRLGGGEFEFILVYSLRRADRVYADEVANLRSSGVTTYEVNVTASPELWNDLKAAYQFMKIVKSEKPDLIHCHSSKAGFIGRVFGKIASWKTPILFTPNVLISFVQPKYNIFERICAPFTTAMIASCESEEIDFQSLPYLNNVPSHVVPLCVDTTYTQKARSRSIAKDSEKKTILIGACGRIARQKQSLLFFKVAALMEHSHPHLRFQWIGDYSESDPESQDVKAFLAANPLSNVEITGWVDDAAEYIRNLDVLLMLSRYESFGYVTADALAMGIPVIGTAVTGTRDLIENGVNGYLVPPKPHNVSSALDQLLEKPDRYNQFSKSARTSMSQNFDISVMCESLSKVYRSYASKR
jgi:glycosyltransferase involved in cell wall biosynthesis